MRRTINPMAGHGASDGFGGSDYEFPSERDIHGSVGDPVGEGPATLVAPIAPAAVPSQVIPPLVDLTVREMTRMFAQPSPARDVLYLSGPMTGIADFNYPAFQKCAHKLRARGYTVVNPHEINPIDRPYHDYMREDFKALVDRCTAIVLLPGWERSQGAKLELQVAVVIGCAVWLWWPDSSCLTASNAGK